MEQKAYLGVIYQIINIQNNKSYIGKTTNNDYYEYIEKHFKNAFKEGDLKKNNKGKYLYNSIRKYGRENFKVIILGVLVSYNKKYLNYKLNEAEKESIWLFRTFGSNGINKDNIYGYNLTKGGDGGDTLSNHPNKKEIFKKCFDPKHYERRHGYKKGYTWDKMFDEETLKQKKKECSIRRSGKNNPNYGNRYKLSEETIIKRSKTREINKLNGKKVNRKKNTEEQNRKIGISCSGEKNGMYNRCAFDIWVIKYGLDVALEKKNAQYKKRKNTMEIKKICQFLSLFLLVDWELD